MPPSDLLRLPVDELRSSRLAELLASIDTADAADAPLLTLLFDKAFGGDAGLQLLRSAAVQEALRATALVHADDAIRSFALVHCKRLAAAAADVSLLGASGVLQQIAVLVSDASLGVSQRAVGFFVACAASSGALRAVLDHAPSRTALLAPCAAAAADPAGGVPALALRTLALFGEIAAIGDAQCAMCEESGALDLALAAWRGSDELVRLNALEVFALLARVPRGLHWLEAHGVVDDLLAQARGAEADGDAPMAEVQLPSVFHCLAELLEAGGDAAVDKALSTGGLLGPLWRQLEPAGGGARDAALAAVRGAACSRRGCILVLRQTASGGAADPLARLLRSSDARAKVGAFAVAAQLCSSCARFAADGEVASVQPALHALIAAVSPSAGTAPGDALAALVALPAEEPFASRTRAPLPRSPPISPPPFDRSCASRRCGCCSASRSTSGAREMGRYGEIRGDTGIYGEIWGDMGRCQYQRRVPRRVLWVRYCGGMGVACAEARWTAHDISPHISLYLPVSPRISPHGDGRAV